jgi:flagellar biosynthesis protein FlhF
MRLKLYRAAGMAEAIAQVRRELGPDALILASRSVADGVEVTAAIDPVDASGDEALPNLTEPARFDPLFYHGVPAELAERLREGRLETTLGRLLSFGDLPLRTGAAPLLLVGPPGAGKTLTVARLATRLVLAGVSPLVITADGRRAGATEQLAAFTRLLGLNLVVASHPVTLRRALTRRVEGAPVLIDAPGCDPFDPVHREEVLALAATAAAGVVMVLPAGVDPNESADLACGFAEMGATFMVPTRLDLARRLGGLLSAAHAAKLCLTEAGTGPGAADGLVRLTPDYLAGRLLRARTATPHAAVPARRMS